MKKQPGFTIIEITVVLVIITALIGSLLIPMSLYYDQTKIELTQQRLEEIKEALLKFAVLNGYLPCPALNINGREADRTTSGDHICNTYDDSDGYLPWATLGAVEYYDGWGNPFRYRVDGWFSNSNGIYKEASSSVGRTKDLLQVKDRQGNLLNVPNYTDPDSGINYRSNIVAIIFSYGKNARSEQGAESATKNNYIQDMYVENQFDDMLIWVPKYVLINRLAAAGRWPPK
jgi:type II secretory pathway pseudopilin PulG